MPKNTRSSADIHKNVPPDWYESSVKNNILQKYWHMIRIYEVGKYAEKVHGDVLDIGSADGYFTRKLLDYTEADSLTGIDILESSVTYARTRYKKVKKLSFQVGDAENLKFGNSKYSAVYMLEALEHVHDAKKVVKEIYRILKPNGYVIILVPSENWLFRFGWPVWTHTRGRVWHETHLNFFKGTTLPELLKRNKFADVTAHTFILGMLLLVKARKI